MAGGNFDVDKQHISDFPSNKVKDINPAVLYINIVLSIHICNNAHTD